MNCEEFEEIGLEAERDASLSEVRRAAVREHASTCSRCAALQDSWQAAGAELRAFAEDTSLAQAPARVEMRLRQEFRTRHVTLKAWRTAVVAAWALAAAAVLLGAVSWRNWRHSQQEAAGEHLNSGPPANKINESDFAARANRRDPAAVPSGTRQPVSTEAGRPEALVADNEMSGFTFLPGAFATDTEEAAILRVRLQRGALGALGLPVNEERASEWIQVDLLVGEDGLPQAVRLPR
jgi:hypothetical protein